MTATKSTATLAPDAQAPPHQLPAPTAVSTPTAVSGSRPFRYTLERYHDAIAAGILTENDRIELIHGQLIEKMSIGKRHRDCVDRLNTYFTTRYIQTHICAVQNPISLPPDSEPEPDYALVNRESYSQRAGNPEPPDIHLVIEVADSSLPFDREVKAPMYATAGLPEYWIINLQHDQVEVYTRPNTATGIYDLIQRYAKDATFTSPFCGEVAAAELLVD